MLFDVLSCFLYLFTPCLTTFHLIRSQIFYMLFHIAFLNLSIQIRRKKTPDYQPENQKIFFISHNNNYFFKNKKGTYPNPNTSLFLLIFHVLYYSLSQHSIR